MSINRQLLAIILSFAAILIFSYIQKIPTRIENGVRGHQADDAMDDVRRPFFAIQAAKTMILKNGNNSEIRAGLERWMEIGNSLLARYKNLAAYDDKLLRRVNILATAYEEWLRSIHSVMAIAGRAKPDKDERSGVRHFEALHEVNIEAASGFSTVLRLLGDTEEPVLDDIEQGSYALTELLVLSGVLLVCVLLYSFILMNSKNRLLGKSLDRQKLVANELMVSEARLAKAQRVARFGNWETDLQNDTLWWSDETYRIFGLSPQKHRATRELFRDLIHPEDRDTVARAHLGVLANNEPYSLDYRIVLANGSVRYVHDQAEVSYDSDGEPVGIEGTIQDITKRKKAENSLHKAHDELELRVFERTKALTEEIQERRAIEAELLERTELQQLLYTVTVIANEADDCDAAMVACLKEICAYTTWPVGHIYAVSQSDRDRLLPTDIWHMEDSEWCSVFHDLTMKTEFRTGVGMPGRVLASGEPEWIEDVAGNPEFIRVVQGVGIAVKAGFGFPIKVKNQVVAVMEFFSPFDQKEDQSLMRSINLIGTQLGRLHERAAAEKSLLAAKIEADSANRSKSDFLSSMSHELRTPLNAIIGFSDIMVGETLGPVGNVKYREYLGDIYNSGQHLLELINDILDVSAIEASGLELQEEDVDLTAVIAASARIIKPLAKKGSVAVTSAVDPRVPMIYADERRIKQVLLNLLSNAIKFTPPGGEVSVGVRLNDGGSIVMTVSDTGIGMDDEGVGKALSRFGQVDSALDRRHEGSGLGLPLTKGLAEMHGGTLEVKSAKNRGTTVIVTFPRERTVRKAAR